MASRDKNSVPNDREAVLLGALIAGEKYGVQLRDAYQAEVKRPMPLGSLYTTLQRMVDKGYLTSREGEATHERGGNRRRYFKISAEGRRSYDRYNDKVREQAFRLGLVGRMLARVGAGGGV